jgi:Lon protease-like protein
MAQVNTDFLDQTVAFWQLRTSQELTHEEGRQIVEHVSAFFRTLLEWEAAERKSATAAAEQESAPASLATGGQE